MGRRERTKGLSFERWVSRKFRKVFPDSRRHLEFQDAEANGVDLHGCGEFLVQCKALKRYASITALEEIQVCPIEGGVPVLVTKGDRREPVAVLYLDDFLKLVRSAAERERSKTKG